MKNSKIFSLILALFCFGVFLTSCQQDNVDPNADKSGLSNLLIDAEDPHPLPDPVCSGFDTIRLVSEDGSFQVNYCGSYGTTPIPCPETTQDWGYVEILNGRDVMMCNFTMAIGWFIDIAQSKFSTVGTSQFDQNGLPIIASDWLPTDIDPVVNKWQLTLPLADLPSPCFDMLLNLTVVKLNFFSGVDANSVTSLWGHNGEWSQTTTGRASMSPYVMPWCPTVCPGDLPAPDSSCIVAYPGLPGGAGCVDLSPDVSGAVGTISYEWNNSATSAAINVCPSADIDYTVTVTDANGPYSVTVFNVVAQDIICTPGNRPSPKVLVCHVPPGNPSNVQTICIDWSGVPAHVEAYRTPEMNPNHGHDSGCHIGPCNSTPCSN
jgi:hypothetical protein